LENMLEIVERIKHSHNPSLNLFGILVTKFDARTTLAQTTIKTIRKPGPPLTPFGVPAPKFHGRTPRAKTTIETIRKAGLPLLEPPIRICVDIIRAQMQGVPITALPPERPARWGCG